MNNTKHVITILGSAGGVANGILSILDNSMQDQQDPINEVMNNCCIHLIDHEQKEASDYALSYPHLQDKFVYHEFDLRDTEQFMAHLRNTQTSVVIDLSWADTVEMLHCCDQLGVSYVNTALENTMIDENEELYEGFGLIERFRHLEKHKNKFLNHTAIIGSGMNPGVVQWMALELLKTDSSENQPIGCYIVEHDNSFYKNPKLAKKNVIYTTWSPECFLDEAILSHPMFIKHHNPLFLYEKGL